ncbi:MAG TPA: hypothetical protein PKJ26_04265 [Candidatus Woesebacteria bacterium]|nr:hypothetical protein [Candidatus Woesebacteria bacterium]
MATHELARLSSEQAVTKQAASAPAPPTSASAPAASPSPAIEGVSNCIFGYTARLWFLRWSNSGTICIGGR